MRAQLLPCLLFGVMACATQATPNTPQDAAMPKGIEQVFREQHDRIMAVPGVVGMGIGLCGTRPCIKVYTDNPATSLAPDIPEIVDGYVIEIEFTGPIRSLHSKP